MYITKAHIRGKNHPPYHPYNVTNFICSYDENRQKGHKKIEVSRVEKDKT